MCVCDYVCDCVCARDCVCACDFVCMCVRELWHEYHEVPDFRVHERKLYRRLAAANAVALCSRIAADFRLAE